MFSDFFSGDLKQLVLKCRSLDSKLSCRQSIRDLLAEEDIPQDEVQIVVQIVLIHELQQDHVLSVLVTLDSEPRQLVEGFLGLHLGAHMHHFVGGLHLLKLFECDVVGILR